MGQPGSADEKRYYCLGKVSDGILTVRFTYRTHRIRIIGAGYWRKGKKIYERENKIHG
ncbi:MAG: BrnT family toxin [Deltaproteobacteria bacterium]|nr:BrnT family toxin [Deltaproteobacteria bacterium]